MVPISFRTAVFLWKKHFIPNTEISVAKSEISVTGALSPASRLKKSILFFYEEKSGEVRSRKSSQLDRLGSYEEALVFEHL